MSQPPGADLARLRRVARLLDSALVIPGTGIRFGWDALIGLVPVLGDVAGATLAGYLVLMAARLGAPTAVILRMLSNVAIDAVGGSIPVLGDLFDIGWRANTRNVELLDRYLASPAAVHRASRAMLAGVVAGLALLAAGGIALGILTIRLLLSWVS
ncbi:MAG TPA: DUF4112 domain-containing protein [Gemmatimonadales bacterium]|nr:DUF4112 domain-containing protein [Gemmatimonadales bacterium]